MSGGTPSRPASTASAPTNPAALARTEAIGLSDQMHGALLLDGAERPVRPAVLWNDGRARRLLPKDWLRLKLTGERATDPGDAADTWMLGQGARAWSPSLAAACGADPAWLPAIVGSDAVSGGLRPDLAARWATRPGTPVAGGGGDTAVGGVGPAGRGGTRMEME